MYSHCNSTDCLIAISLESMPLHQHGFLDTGPEFDLHEELPEQLNPSYNSPYAPQSLYPDFFWAESLGIHPATARILDDVRPLFAAILALSSDSPAEDVAKVQETAKQIHDRINDLHDVLPGGPPGSPHPTSSTRTPSSTNSTPSASSSSHSASSSTTQQPRFISQSHDPRHLLLRTAPQPDFIYATIRQTALLYSRAAAARLPLSVVCPTPQFYALWATLWRVPLRRWHSLLGLFLWVVLALLPTGGLTQFATMVKSLLHIGAVQMGLDHWEVCIGMLRGAVGVVAWLAGGERPREEGDTHMAESTP